MNFTIEDLKHIKAALEVAANSHARFYTETFTRLAAKVADEIQERRDSPDSAAPDGGDERERELLRKVLRDQFIAKFGRENGYKVFNGPWSMEEDAAIRAITAALRQPTQVSKTACIWPDCGHDTNQSNSDPRCNGKFCPKAAPAVELWRFVERAFDSSKTSTSERFLECLGLPIDEAQMPLSWHINRAKAKE